MEELGKTVEDINSSELYNEGYIRKLLIMYDDMTGDNLSVADIKKSVEEGNPDKKESIKEYGEWWRNKYRKFDSVIDDAYYGKTMAMKSDPNTLYNSKYGQRELFDLSDEEFKEVYLGCKDEIEEELRYLENKK